MWPPTALKAIARPIGVYRDGHRLARHTAQSIRIFGGSRLVNGILSRIVRILLVAGLLVLCPWRVEPAQLAALRPCRISDADALCGSITVPEDRSRPQARVLSLRVRILRATRAATQPPLYAINGGPGASSVDMAETLVRSFTSLRRERDIVLVDQRGSGGSNVLQCTAVPGRPFVPADGRGCLKRLARRADLRFYGTDDFVQDLDDVRAALGHEQIDIYGISYGTRAGWWYARRFPQPLRSVVLLSPNPPSQRLFVSVGEDTNRVLDAIVADCQARADCARAFPRLAANLQAALTTVAGERLTGLPLLLYSTQTARRLPWLIHRSQSGNAPALDRTLAGALRDGQSQVALGLLLTVQCSEELTVNRRLADRPISARTWDTFSEACEGWPRISVPCDFRDRFSSPARALVISGEWDPITGPRWAQEMGTFFGRSTVLTISKGTHGLSDVAPCLSRIITAFLDEREASTGCLAALESLRYFVP